jgi:hypothetical protein
MTDDTFNRADIAATTIPPTRLFSHFEACVPNRTRGNQVSEKDNCRINDGTVAPLGSCRSLFRALLASPSHSALCRRQCYIGRRFAAEEFDVATIDIIFGVRSVSRLSARYPPFPLAGFVDFCFRSA